MALSLSYSKHRSSVALSEHCLYSFMFNWEQHCLAAGRATFHVLSSFLICKMRGRHKVMVFKLCSRKALVLCRSLGGHRRRLGEHVWAGS